MMTAIKYFCKDIIQLLTTAVKQAIHIHPIINHRHSKLNFRSLVNVLEVTMHMLHYILQYIVVVLLMTIIKTIIPR
jgi:hypothetical protein